MKIKNLMLICFLAMGTSIFAQDEAPVNWFNLDKGADGIAGVSTEKMYTDLLKGKSSETVIVAVIDSGVDYMHEDLKDVMWVNPGEIAGNGIDDDNNGYIDDIHGWNFIGGKNGKNIGADALEVTRLAAYYGKKFKDVDPSKLKKKEKKQYNQYLIAKKVVDDKQAELATQSETWFDLQKKVDLLQTTTGKDDFTADDLKAIESDDADVTAAVERMNKILARGATCAEIREQIKGASGYFNTQMTKWYNVDFDPRAEIVGDNYMDSSDRNYGNNDVKGPDAGHGTHVAGIIGAVRHNDVGIKGVSDNVRIMSIRAVPDGDERDKDVANAIFYAVDNGATIINMSFGKSFSYDKGIVDKAVRYAQKKDVLLVHAAGNDAKNTDNADNFPTDKYEKRGWLKGLFKSKTCNNWLEVGALSYKKGEDAVASFSNYGKEEVDVFAPGYQINSTIPEQGYAKFSGTSMAAPVTAGAAAVLRSYYPSLTAAQVKSIIMEACISVPQKVKQPGTKELVSFSELCQTAGIVNVYKAVKIAEKTKGKKKIKKKAASVVTP